MTDIPISLVCAECGVELHGEVNPLAYKTAIKVTPCERCATVPVCVGCGESLDEKLCDDCAAPTDEQKAEEEKDWLGAEANPWKPLSVPPTAPADVFVRGTNVSQRVMCSYSCWRWDGFAWWCEDGTERADELQMAGAFWMKIPR